MGLPYSEETIREAVSLLQEQAAIEGDGICRAIRKVTGVTGCVVTPLTIETAPLLLVLALGQAGQSVYVSETRNLYRHSVELLPSENSMCFDLIQARGVERWLYEGCRIKGFELRIMRDEAIKLRLDVTGEYGPVIYPYTDTLETAIGERFNENGVTYFINNTEYKNIYGLTIVARKEGGTKTEIWIHRILDKITDFPSIIEKLTIMAQLYRNKYDCREYGLFRLTLSRLVLMADETTIDSAGAVIGPMRYYCAGGLSTEVFTNNEDHIE
jgi:hypothetical protein